MIATLSNYGLQKYQFGKDVRKMRQMYGMSGKIIYEGRWMQGRTDPIIVVEMNEVITEREAAFYLEVNNHLHIISTLGYIENSVKLTIFIQEYAPQGDLAGYLMDNPNTFTLPSFAEVFLQIADAMSYIASKRIVHGDLGCRNVLVFRVDETQLKNNLVRITDFGLARFIDKKPARANELVIPVRYCAPEILRTNRHSDYSEKSDVYSLGVLIWEALSNSEIPYSAVDKDDVVKEMKLNNEKLTRPHPCSDGLWNLMKKCWHTNPDVRPSFALINEELSHIDVSDSRDVRSSISLHEIPTNYKYELDEDIRIQNLLGGQFGKIYEAEWISRKERPIVVIQMDTEPSEYEAMVYTNFDLHRNIVDTFGFITEAMIYLVGENFVHGDLRCSNVLVVKMDPSDPERNLVKLTNFSRACPIGQSVGDRKIPASLIPYCAPEIRRNRNTSSYSELSEVYSMGVLMWQACSQGAIPFAGDTSSGDTRRRASINRRLGRPKQCQENLWAVISDCFLNEPELRFSFNDLKTQISRIDFRHQRPVRCENCGQQYAATEIGTHRKTCPSRPIIHVRPPPQPRGIQCVNCNRQIPQNEITAHRNICRPKPISCMERFCSWISHCCAKN
ncbi:unnamed protein product [Rotaria socialis]